MTPQVPLVTPMTDRTADHIPWAPLHFLSPVREWAAKHLLRLTRLRVHWNRQRLLCGPFAGREIACPIAQVGEAFLRTNRAATMP
jgi:hypothetical protein